MGHGSIGKRVAQFYSKITNYDFVVVERSILIDALQGGERKNILRASLRSDFSHSLGLMAK